MPAEWWKNPVCWMGDEMERIAVIPNALRDIGLTETKNVVALLTRRKITVFMEERFSSDGFCDVCFCSMETMLESAQAAVVLGGDGTILEIAPRAAQYDLPLMGINLGHLGFLAQAEKGDYTIFDVLLRGDYTVMNCMMLDCGIFHENREIGKFVALNDVVVSGDGYSRMVKLSASVNGTCIGTYSADGLIAATAVGSTAYSLSAGGAVMHPEMDAIMLTPICPHTLKARSMVVPGDDRVEIVSCPPYRSTAVVMVDGKRRHVLAPEEYIQVTRSQYRTKLINANNRNFFDVLREKLSD